MPESAVVGGKAHRPVAAARYRLSPRDAIVLVTLALLVVRGHFTTPSLFGLVKRSSWAEGALVTFDPLWIEPTLHPAFQALVWSTLGAVLAVHVQSWRGGLQRAAQGKARWLAQQMGRLLIALLSWEIGLHGALALVGPERASLDRYLLDALSRPQAALSSHGVYVWDLDRPTRPDSLDDLLAARSQKPRQPNELRILCLGDSWTSGSGVLPAEAWPAQLAGALQQRFPARACLSLNGGRRGASWMQVYLLLAERGLAASPDLVVFGGAHWETDHLSYQPFAPRPSSEKLAVLLSHLSLGASAVGSLRHGFVPSLVRTSSAEYVQRCVALLRSRGIPMLFFEHPGKSERQAWLRSVLVEGGGVYLANQAKLTWDPATCVIVDGHGTHPSQRGHQAIARWLDQQLRLRGH